MQLKDIRNMKDKKPFIALYETSFPSEERKPFGFMEALMEEGKMDMLAILDEGRFVGLAAVLLAREAVLLDYFAISPSVQKLRLRGRALGMLTARYGRRRMILEIEMEDPQAENARERVKRKAFYLRNGIRETGIYANVYCTDFELLSSDGKLSYEEYVQVMEESMGAACVEKLCPRRIFKNLTESGTDKGGEG